LTSSASRKRPPCHRRAIVTLSVALTGLSLGAGVATAATAPRSAQSQEAVRPVIRELRCVAACPSRAHAEAGRSTIRLRGLRLARVTRVVFHGGPGRADNVAVPARAGASGTVKVLVPGQAKAGRLTAWSGTVASPPTRSLRIAPGAAREDTSSDEDGKGGEKTAPKRRAAAVGGHAFPIRGAHDFGQAGAAFGAGRNGRSHQGQDVFAACGTPLVAARGGTVKTRAFQGLAGNYVVITGDGSGLDYVYMHLAAPASVAPGVRVATGQRIGLVGATGNARGCHLHFELWTAPGWQAGGSPIDPLPSLRTWDAST